MPGDYFDTLQNSLGGDSINIIRLENYPTYYTYKTDNLVIFSTNYRTYGPFQYRNDLIRISVTIRPKGETQLKVRASIQHNIRAIEEPEVYQRFFKLLGKSQFLSNHI